MLKWLSQELRREMWYAVLLAIIAGIAGAIFVRGLITAGHDIADGNYSYRDLLRLILIVVVFVITKRIAYQKIARVAQDALHDQVLTIANYLRQAELLEIEQQPRAELYTALADAQTLTTTAQNTITAVRCIVTIFVCWLYMFALSRPAGLLFIGMLLLLYLIIEVHDKLYTTIAHAEHTEETTMFQSFHHLLVGHKELALNRSKNEDLFTQYLQPAVLRVALLGQQRGVYFARQSQYRDSLYYLVIGSFVFILSGWYPISIILSLLTISLYLWPLVVILFNMIPSLATGRMAMDRLYELSEDLKPGAEVSPGLPFEERIVEFESLSLHAIHFAYATPDGASEFAIGPISFTIKAGDILFIAGGNGSGKSTLLKVLTGLYPMASGGIVLNGHPVDIRKHGYLFSAVFNDFHVFDRLYGLETIDDQEVNQLLLQLELLNVTQWRQGRFTATTLSMGQKRRLALATALLEQKPIYIFDEWAADQSSTFRQYFYKTLLPSLKQQGKTVIAVTHDDHYYDVADRVIKMEYGKIIDDRVREP
jgi:putative pyoverdin transport system ATP-binding/permease protein